MLSHESLLPFALDAIIRLTQLYEVASWESSCSLSQAIKADDKIIFEKCFQFVTLSNGID